MRYREIIQPEILDEIEIVPPLNPPAGHAQTFLGGSLVAQETFGDIYHNSFPQQQDVYYIGDQSSVFSYVIVENRGGHLWLLEAFTEAQHRNNNLSSQLIRWVVKRLGKVIVDRQLAPIAARMFERMIAAGLVKASIVDFQTNMADTYNPDNPVDQAKPMYDRAIPGVNRPLLPLADAERYTWMLESGFPRRGILTNFQRYL